MKKNKKFEAFLTQHFKIKNEALAIENLKNYMFSLSTEEMLLFMDYNKRMVFDNFIDILSNPLCTDEERSEISNQVNKMETILTSNRASKAA